MRKVFVFLLISAMMGVSCKTDSNRRIKLADGPFGGSVTGKTSTIKLAATKKRSIAVIYFANETNNRSLDWLQSGIAEMLGTDLAQSRQFYIIPSSMTQETLHQNGWGNEDKLTQEDAISVARQLHAYAFLLGRYYQRRDSLVIETELRRTEDGAVLGNQAAHGPRLENVFIMVDQLSRQLRNDLQLSMRQSSSAEMAAAVRPTQSVEAYKKYLQALDHFDKLHFQEALSLFEQSVALDSAFAAAYYYSAAISADHTNQIDRARELIEKGLKLSDRMNLRDLLSLRALDAALRGDVTRALALHQERCELYPEDATAFFNLGVYLFGLRRYQEAVEYLEQVVHLNPRHKMVYNMLGYTYAQLYKVDLARQALKKYAELGKGEANPYDSLGDLLMRFGLVDDAADAYEQALKIDPNFTPSVLNLIRALVERGKIQQAQTRAIRTLEKIEHPMDKANLLIIMAQMQMAQDDEQGALRYLQQAVEVDPRQTSLAVLIQSRLDVDQNEARLRQWLQKIRSLNETELGNYQSLVTFAILCIENEALLAEVKALLDDYEKVINSPFRNTIISAYRQILHTYARTGDYAAIFNLSEESLREVLQYMPSIPWDSYWRFFYRALLRSAGDVAGMQPFITAQRDMARSVGNIAMDAQYSNVLALIETLRGNLASADEIRMKIGMPDEKSWRFSGPYPALKGFSQAFDPEKKIKEQKIIEQEWRFAFDGIPDGYINMNDIFRRDLNVTGYALLTVTAANPTPACLRLGCNRPVKLWLNHQPLVTLYEYSSARMDNNIFWVKLHSGSNRIMIKLNSHFGNAGFYLRITDKSGYGIPDVTFGESETVLLSQIAEP